MKTALQMMDNASYPVSFSPGGAFIKHDLKISLLEIFLPCLIYGLFIYYLTDLETIEDCQCSLTSERLFMKWWFVFVISALVFSTVAKKYNFYPSLVARLFGAAIIVGGSYFLYCVFVFTREMREKECYCSQSLFRSLIELFSFFNVVIIIFALGYLLRNKKFLELRIPKKNLRKNRKK